MSDDQKEMEEILETEEQETTLAQELNPEKEQQEEPQDAEEVQDNQEPPSEEKPDELARKQEEYRKRQQQKLSKQEERQEELVQKSNEAVENSGLNDIEDIKRELMSIKERERKQQEYEEFQQKLEGDEKGYKVLEAEYKEAFPDYEDDYKLAEGFLIDSYTSKGMTPEQAQAQLKYERLVLANQAVVAGKDPIEVVHEEAKKIKSVIEKHAESLGYVKAGKKKTNMQALREISKPNAVNGGSGSGAVKRTFEELDNDDMDEIDNVSIGQLLKGNY